MFLKGWYSKGGAEIGWYRIGLLSPGALSSNALHRVWTRWLTGWALGNTGPIWIQRFSSVPLSNDLFPSLPEWREFDFQGRNGGRAERSHFCQTGRELHVVALLILQHYIAVTHLSPPQPDPFCVCKATCRLCLYPYPNPSRFVTRYHITNWSPTCALHAV